MSIALTVTLAIGVVALAVIVQDVTAFGFGLVATPLLMSLGGRYTTNTVLQLTVVTMAWPLATAWLRRRRSVPGARSGAQRPSPGVHRHDNLYLATALSLVGIWCGHELSREIPIAAVKLIIGVLVVAAALASIARLRLPETPLTLAIGGFVGGILTPLTATPGPPVVLVYHELDLKRRQLQLSLYFLVGSIVSCIVATFNGYGDVSAAMPLVAGILLGKLLSPRVVRLFRPSTVLFGARLLCVASGVGLAVSAIVS